MHTASDPKTDDGDRLLTTKEVAELIGYKPGTLRQWRTKDRGPRYLKDARSRQGDVRYLRSDVEAWMQRDSHFEVVDTTE